MGYSTFASADGDSQVGGCEAALSLPTLSHLK